MRRLDYRPWRRLRAFSVTAPGGRRAVVARSAGAATAWQPDSGCWWGWWNSRNGVALPNHNKTGKSQILTSPFEKHRKSYYIRYSQRGLKVPKFGRIENDRLRDKAKSMTTIGYMRVSKADGSQGLDLQRAALLSAGVIERNLYSDTASGKEDDRPGLAACLKALRADD